MIRLCQGFIAAGLLFALATPSFAAKQDNPNFEFPTPVDSVQQESAAQFKEALLSREMSEDARAILSETSPSDIQRTGEGVCQLVSDGIDKETYLAEFSPGESPAKEAGRHIWNQALQTLCSPATGQ
ncbi:MAG: hypothetical protein KME19_22370 [Microcoleus vaginatus WJT46-NPBG5]|jgi:hypothetical protein|nr:hypothetical protein [Microcoleus vaginatus WJT46-NPBG5]